LALPGVCIIVASVTRNSFKLLAGMAIVGLAILLWFSPSLSPARLHPNPNGCTDFILAGQLVTSFPSDLTMTNQEDLRSYLGANAEPLRLIHQGLARECRISWGSGPNRVQQHMDELATFKQLVRLLEFQAQLAELDGHTNEAARLYLKIIRFGNEAVRGGNGIDRLVGIAIENRGTGALEKLVPQLDAQTRREIAEGIKQIDAHRESVEEVIRGEREWRRINSTWYQRLIFAIPVQLVNPTRRLEQNLTAKISRQKAQEDRLARTLRD
jgi:hypothetical protein